MKKLLLLGAIAMLPSMAARADIIPTNDSITGGPGAYTWSYFAQVTQDQTAFAGHAPASQPVQHAEVNGGAFFTIYDFAGYIAGTCTSPTGWSCTVQNVGFTPDAVNPVAPPDNPGIVNLTWSYNQGAPIIGSQYVYGFSAMADNAFVTQTSFAARATKNIGSQAGTFVDNVGNVDAPVGLPEPASLGLLGLAVAGLAAACRRKA